VFYGEGVRTLLAGLAVAVALVMTGCTASSDPKPAPSTPPLAPSMSSAAGATNPAVTDATVGQTICVPGWTASIRPKLPTRAGYQHDHVIPLELGGAPTDGANLAYVPLARAKADDQVENLLHRLVCSHDMRLADAQRFIVEVKRRG
jgi:hypothetical protein